MTAVEWLIEKIDNEDMGEIPMWVYDYCYDALEMEREQRINTLIAFQLFLSERRFISDHLWDFEDMALKFIDHEEH